MPKGSDQTITAKLLGFDAEDANLMVRRTADGKFEPLPLSRTENGTYEGLLFDINGPLDYFVEADGVRSETYSMQVVEVPYVQRLELEFVYPAYTGLEPQKIEDGGDIAVLRGATVKVHVVPTMKTAAGRLSLNDSQQVPLVVQPDGTLVASFVADKDGAYVVQLQAPNGEFVVGSPKYAIDVLDDGAPTVSFVRPGRDTTASAVEEVFVEAKAADDYGVRNLELVYSVNGGAEKVVPLFQGKNRLPEVTAGHTFYLEELGLQVGDSVSYYARAMDNDAAGGACQARVERPLLRAHPSVQQGLPPGAVAGRRGRRRWRGRWRSDRGALGAAAADHLGDLQRPARPEELHAREAEAELHRGGAVAVAPARAGREHADAHEQPARGEAIRSSRRSASCCPKPSSTCRRPRRS